MKSKLIILLALLLGLVSCLPMPTPTEESPQPTATSTPKSVQVEAAPEAKKEEPAPTATFTLIPEALSCIELLTPEDKTELPAEGKVTFSWTALDEAALYSLNFIFPDGLTLEFETNETTKNRYMEAFSMHPAYTQDGKHQWNVTALNAAGEEICISDIFVFTKPQSDGDSGDGNGGPGG